MLAQDIIIRPLLTEKGYDGIADKKYTFIVAKSANKTQIKDALGEYVWKRTKRRPMIIPIIMEV